MSGDFIDSNVFIYLFDETNPEKSDIAKDLIHQGILSGKSQISFQVVQETLNVITQKLKKPAARDQAQQFLDKVLVPLWRVMPSERIYRSCLEIQSRYRYGLYDALIIAAALDAGCTKLWSEDLQGGQQIDRLMIENPFVVVDQTTID